MADEQILKEVRRFVATASSKGLPVVGGVLYGSYARGTEGPNSDIDIMVLVRDNVSKANWMDLWVELEMLAHEIDIRIETWPVRISDFRHNDGTPLIDIARTEGIEIAA